VQTSAEQFLADRTALMKIGYRHDNVVYLSICPSVCLWRCALWLLAKQHRLPQQKCLNKRIKNSFKGLFRQNRVYYRSGTGGRCLTNLTTSGTLKIV